MTHLKQLLLRNVSTPLARRRFLKKGQTLVEYALILAFISVVAIVVLIRLGKNVTSVFSAVNSQLQVAQVSH